MPMSGRRQATDALDAVRLFIDLTKNLSRRYLEAQYANRIHAAYRQRRDAWTGDRPTDAVPRDIRRVGGPSAQK